MGRRAQTWYSVADWEPIIAWQADALLLYCVADEPRVVNPSMGPQRTVIVQGFWCGGRFFELHTRRDVTDAVVGFLPVYTPSPANEDVILETAEKRRPERRPEPVEGRCGEPFVPGHCTVRSSTVPKAQGSVEPPVEGR